MAVLSVPEESCHPLSRMSNTLASADCQAVRVARNDVRHFSFLQDLAEPLKNVVATAYGSRGKLYQDMKNYVIITSSAVVSMPRRISNVVHNPKLHAVFLEEEDPEALAAVVCGTGAALCLGSIGAVVGTSLGAVSGVVAGTVPAIFTFGLSLPIGLLAGGSTGLGMGMVIGCTAGCVGGAASGGTIAYYRVEIRSTTNGVVAKVDYAYDKLIYQPTQKVKGASRAICERTSNGTTFVKDNFQALVSSRHAHVTAGGAVAGAAAVGTAGAAGGALAGGAAGAACGLPLALFTFGLSIPVGAVIGGGIGLCAGTAAGASTGFVGGAAAGYTGYACRETPARAIGYAKDRWHVIRGTEMRPRSSSGGTEGSSGGSSGDN